MRQVEYEHVILKGENRTEYKVLFGKPERKGV
jgi:hypothetical protein